MTSTPLGSPTSAATRDRFLDVVRALAVLAVVVQHWTMPVLTYSDGHLSTGNALTTPGWWTLTWLSQVIPLVFFTGGAANVLSLRRALSARGWLTTRLRRLLLPVLPLIGVWLVVPAVLRTAGIPEQPVAVAASIAAQLLWFLGVYLLTVLATPALVAAHRRWGPAVPLVLTGAAGSVDIARFGGVELIGYVNAVFVWLAVHQIGFFYADGRLSRLSRRGALTMAASGFTVTAILVAFGPYAASMIGMPGAPVSNMSPPAVCLVSLAVGQIGLVLAARPGLTALTGHPMLGAALRWTGPRFMSVYLWHMPALIVLAGVTVLGAGYATPAPGTPAWLVAAPGWLVLAAAVLAVLLRMFGRFESSPSTALGTVPAPAWRLVAAALLGATGTLGLAATGFADAPLPWATLVVLAYALIRWLPGGAVTR